MCQTQPKRYNEFLEAIEKDTFGRVKNVEIEDKYEKMKEIVEKYCNVKVVL